MNYKYVIIGINIIFASIVAIGVAVYAGYEALLGAGFSLLTLGIIIAGIGLTFIEPLDRFYRDMARIYSLVVGKVFEDIGLIHGSAVMACRDQDLVILATRKLSCNHLIPGIGVVDGTPYIALPINMLIEERIGGTEPSQGLGGFEDFLRNTVLFTYGIGRDLTVREEGGRLTVRVHDVREDAHKMLKLPLSPFKVLVTALASNYLRKDVIAGLERFVGDDYMIELRVV